MADRNSAEVFGFVFEKLAANPTDEHKKMAQELYEFSERFDFTWDQMGWEVEGHLMALGIEPGKKGWR